MMKPKASLSPSIKDYGVTDVLASAVSTLLLK